MVVGFYSMLGMCLGFLITFGLPILIGTDHNVDLLQASNERHNFLNVLRR